MSPIAGSTPYNTAVFTLTEMSMKYLKDTDMKEENKSFLAGAFAGGCSLVVYVPFELVKVRA